MPSPSEEGRRVWLHEGLPLVTADDVARFLGVPTRELTFLLYKASEDARYTPFEIPKRSGGMRQIHAPTKQLKDWQRKVAAVLQEKYDAHPAAHGFIKERSILTNAKAHVGQRLVFNIDLSDFFPSINFGRVRGLFMAEPFLCGPAAAAVLAQLCTHKNGLPQGAPTSPPLSNFIAHGLDRRLARIAREQGAHYSRYADDITFSTNKPAMPPAIAHQETGESGMVVFVGDAAARAIEAAGFAINQRKVRLQRHSQRQSVTGLSVNTQVNVTRNRIRRLRAMLHAWERYGVDDAARAHFLDHRGLRHVPNNPGRAFRNVLYGELSFIKMVRGREDPVFLKLCAHLLELDPNPSRFVRQMAFGADDFDVFISHASEDKDEIARPIFEACQALGLKAFMDEAHIGWGQSFTMKINTALGAARIVLAVISPTSVTKDWPVAEVNAALNLEVSQQKKVVPLLVGKPDLARLPLIASKDCMTWTGDAAAVAQRLHAAKEGDAPRRPSSLHAAAAQAAANPAPSPALAPPPAQKSPPAVPRPVIQKRTRRRLSFWEWLFGARPRRK